MSQGNRIRVSIIEEATWGTTPTTGNLYVIPYTSFEGIPMVESTESETVRDDRQLRTVIKTMESAEGSIDAEMNLVDEVFRLILEGAAMADRSTAVAIFNEDTIEIDGVSGEISSTDPLFGNLSVGQWFRMDGFTNNANNGFFRVTGVSSASAFLAEAQGLVTEAAGDSINITSQELVFPGTTDKFYTIQVEYLDLGVIAKITGVMIDEATGNLPIGDKITLSFSFMGRRWEEIDTDLQTAFVGIDLIPYAEGSDVQVPTSLASVALLEDNRTSFGARNVQTLEFTISNALEKRYGIGKGRFPSKIRVNTNRITGSLTEDVSSLDLINKSLDERFTPHSMSYLVHTGLESEDLESSEVRSWMFEFPSVVYTDPSIDNAGLDGEAELSNSFTAIANPLKQLRICFFDLES